MEKMKKEDFPVTDADLATSNQISRAMWEAMNESATELNAMAAERIIAIGFMWENVMGLIPANPHMSLIQLIFHELIVDLAELVAEENKARKENAQ